MVNSRYMSFLRKILQETKENKIKWYYLDSNIHLCEEMQWTDKKTFANLCQERALYFNNEDSFYTELDETYIVIFVEDNNPAIVYVIPNTFKKIIVLDADEYGELNTRLLNLVQSQFPNADAFITNFINQD